ncbi:Zn-ribbon domain-containing OB-fold protein [bacterium]|nr:Zn-ribbon domain-containing OB-fold protein [bacterium]
MAQTLTGRVWREQPQRYRMIANKDTETGEIYFPPRLVAPGNLDATFEEVQLSGSGKVVTFTIIRVAPTPYADLAPYALAVVETEDGVRLTCQLTDLDVDDVKIGMPVQFEFRKLYDDNEASVIYYGYKAVQV